MPVQNRRTDINGQGHAQEYSPRYQTTQDRKREGINVSFIRTLRRFPCLAEEHFNQFPLLSQHGVIDFHRV